MDDETDVTQTDVNEQNEQNISDDKHLTFDDMLAGNKDYQAEFDRKVAKALSTAKAKWESMTDEKLSEAEKLSKMTKDEKAQYQLSKKEKELQAKEQELNRKELMSTAKAQLSEAGVSTELAELLNYTDAEACKKSIETLTQAFNKAVEKAVESKLKGGSTMRKAEDNDTLSEAEKILNIMRNA